eukprot:4109230-Amphidinium_carterae.1
MTSYDYVLAGRYVSTLVQLPLHKTRLWHIQMHRLAFRANASYHLVLVQQGTFFQGQTNANPRVLKGKHAHRLMTAGGSPD